jgi:hypothetical protein
MMKLTTKLLKQLIKEEMSRMNEGIGGNEPPIVDAGLEEEKRAMISHMQSLWEDNVVDPYKVEDNLGIIERDSGLGLGENEILDIYHKALEVYERE